jgi:hypothetical protein
VELLPVISDIVDTLFTIDFSRKAFKSFQPGVGPYGEPQLLQLIRERLNVLDAYRGSVVTKRTPDLLLRGHWALEVKIVRPFGDNGKPAENWSVNLLHPYEGNVSAIGDCLKLLDLNIPERKAVVIIAYEHAQPKINLSLLLEAFEVVAKKVAKIGLGRRYEVARGGLVHPVHQHLRVIAWEVLGRTV